MSTNHGITIFLDTAEVEVIKQWIPTGLIDGVTTNPTLLSRAKKDPRVVLQEICALLPQGHVSIEVTEKSPDAVYKQALALAALATNVVVKIPCHKDYFSVIHRLVNEGIKLNITLVFTLGQGLMMAKLGVVYISPFVGRWDDIDVDGIPLLHELRAMIDTYGYKTKVLAASLRHVRHVHQAIDAGVHVLTIPVEVFDKLVDNPLTNQGIALFDKDWAAVGIKQFP